MLIKTGPDLPFTVLHRQWLLQSYYEIDGVVKNTGFFFENEIATNISSFGSGQKSEFNIVACEPLSTVVFDKDKLFQAAKQASEIETLGRNCIRLFATKQEEFSTLFKRFSAQVRLEYLAANYPEILQRVSLSQLASFLGVARETLSRIRKRSVLSSSCDDRHRMNSAIFLTFVENSQRYASRIYCHHH
ncbi:Crp/Fnr family transcriptional regulator [Parapedobacter koreensis]|uniref:cAMP-binding domain of CRP or a regulatory subunit of cAMP-dependent protein kinases n=1 Tax=Parapedobacter koreensis TaxID=332977 RepID=A0A1H7SPK7_9SPHI|nr:hypothetical protein [Parapedobacter koreensis]SEL74395.1 hypothetical protein SAMN05421740_109107 [Parapedobacter koreensis]